MAGTFRVKADIQVSGPLADGRAEDAMKRWAERTAKALQANLHLVTAGPVARIPGPNIKGVVWTPWLEGTSQRNESTGFRGYHLFRKTRLQLQKRAPEVGQRELDRIMPEIGGDA